MPWPGSVVDYRILYDAGREVFRTYAYPAGYPYPPPAAALHAVTTVLPFDLAQRVAEPLLAPLATTGIVLILVVFILLYREDLRDRIIRLAGARDLHRTLAAMDDAAYRLSRYFLAQVGLNSAFGMFIAAGVS